MRHATFVLCIFFVAFFVLGPFYSAHAALDWTGNVEPTDPAPPDWTSSTDGYVGNTADGTLTLGGGYNLDSSRGYIGFGETINGTVTVNGTGSTWMNDGNLFIGRSGFGMLNIEAGGQVCSNYSCLGIRAGSTGTATVTGDGSTWANSMEFTVGDGGSGTLQVKAGGQINNKDGFLGRVANSTGNATVTGVFSTWTNNRNLYVGVNGSGTLHIEDGGLVSVNGSLTIDENGGNDSFINMAAGGMLALFGNAAGSINDYLDRVSGTDAIRYWDEATSDWAPITSATPGTDYTLTYVNDTGSELYQYNILTVLTETDSGDANWDGMVNELDAAVLAANWGKAGGWSNGDFNHDGRVNAADASILAANWGQGTEGLTTVPEPTGLAMLLVLALGTLRSRW